MQLLGMAAAASSNKGGQQTPNATDMLGQLQQQQQNTSTSLFQDLLKGSTVGNNASGTLDLSSLLRRIQ